MGVKSISTVGWEVDANGGDRVSWPGFGPTGNAATAIGAPFTSKNEPAAATLPRQFLPGKLEDSRIYLSSLCVSAALGSCCSLGSWSPSAEIRVFGVSSPDLALPLAVRREPRCRRWGVGRAPRPATGFGTGQEPVGVPVAANGWRCSKVK
jgi:hypothetical protein